LSQTGSVGRDLHQRRLGGVLTKKIHASRSAAADLIHALACGYARGGDAGLAVTGSGFLPGPQRGSGAGWLGRDII